MSLPFGFEQLASLRDDARLLFEREGDHESQLEAFVAAAEHEMLHVAGVAAHAAESVRVEEIRHLLSAQLERITAGAGAATRLLAGARQQRALAGRLLGHLEVWGGRSAGAPH